MPANENGNTDSLAPDALKGDKEALEALIGSLQPTIFRLAQRFLINPADAEDAVQEILIRIITRLSTFEGKSSIATWAYAVAVNYLRDLKRKAKPETMSFDDFSEDLKDGLTDNSYIGPDEELMREEVRIGCTLAMLQCLEDEARLAYILGDILELDHSEASRVLDCSNVAFRKRLSRAREKIISFMMGNCGLINPDNKCRCSKRAVKAIELQRVQPDNFRFALSVTKAREFPEVLAEIRKLESHQRAAALYRAQNQPEHTEQFAKWLRKLLTENSTEPVR